MQLTDRQQAILDFLTAFQAGHGYPPTRAEIARAFGFSQARSAEDHLRALAAKGAIVLEAGGAICDLTGRPIFPFDLTGYGGAKVPYLSAAKSAQVDILQWLRSHP